MRPGRWWGIALGASLACAEGCGLPQRDNPNDPRNSPKLVLRVFDVTDVNGGCPPTLPDTASLETLTTAGRGRCLALDATGSTSLTGNALTFEFLVSTSAGTFASLGPPTATAWKILDATTRRSLPARRPLTFRVRGASGGSAGTLDVPFVLGNGRPSVRTLAARDVPFGQLPWLTSAVTLPFRALDAHDPDGDPLTYCWTFSDGVGPVCSNQPDDPAFNRSVFLGTGGTLVGRLTVDDGDLSSPPVFSRVRSAPRALDFRDNGNVTRFVGGQRDFVYPHGSGSLYGGPSIVVGPPGSQRLVSAIQTDPSAGFGTGLVSAPIPAASPVSSPIPIARTQDLAGGLATPALVATDGDAELWVAADAPDATLELFDLGQVPPAPQESIALSVHHGLYEPYLLAVDDEDIAWVAGKAGRGGIERVSPSAGPLALLDTDGALAFTALGKRPNHDEVWAVRSKATGSATIASPELVRYSGATGAAIQRIPMPFEFAYQLLWLDDDRFWLAVPDVGLLVVDASRLETGTDVADAVTSVFPELLMDAFSALTVDPLTGEAYGIARSAAGGGKVLFHANADGFLEQVVAGTPELAPVAVDAGGRLWLSNATFLVGEFVTSPPDFEQVTDISDPNHLSQPFRPSMSRLLENRADGSFWGLDSTGPALVQLSPDGEVEASYYAVQESNGALVTLPASLADYSNVFMAPDGDSLWGLGELPGTGFYFEAMRFDLTTRPPTIHHLGVLQTPYATDGGAPDQGGPMLWVAPIPFYSTYSPHDVRFLDDSGAPQTVFSMTSTPFEVAIAATVLPAENDLCLASYIDDITVVTTTETITVRRVHRAGGATSLATFAVTLPSRAPITYHYGDLADAAWSPQEEDCWIADNPSAGSVNDNPPGERLAAIRVYRTDGVLRHSADLLLSLHSLRAIGPDEAYLTGFDGSLVEHAYHLTFTSATAYTLVDLGLTPGETWPNAFASFPSQ